MPLRSSKRLPRRFNRPVTKQTRAFVSRKHKRRTEQRRERFRRFLRKVLRMATEWRRVLQRWVLVSVASIVVLAFGLVLFSPIVQVREIRVQRSDVRVDAEKVQRALSPVFGRHLFFLSQQEVVTLASEAVPDLVDLRIDKQYPSRLVLRMTLEPIIARLSIASPDASGDAILKHASGTFVPEAETTGADVLTTNGRYVLHPNGKLLEELPMITIVDWGVRPVPGDRLLESSFLETLYAAEEGLQEQFGLDVQSRTVFLRAREFHIEVQGMSLWFDVKSPLAEQIGRYKTFLRTIPTSDVKEYVDLRLSDRIVYR